MRGLPINIINLICKWARSEETIWFPFFCPKTHKLSWKVNKYSKKFIENGNILNRNLLNNSLLNGTIKLYNYSTYNINISNYQAILLKIESGRKTTLEFYLQFFKFKKSENENNDDMFRGKVDFYLFENDLDIRLSEYYTLFLNNKPYALIHECNINKSNYNMNMEIELL